MDLGGRRKNIENIWGGVVFGRSLGVFLDLTGRKIDFSLYENFGLCR